MEQPETPAAHKTKILYLVTKANWGGAQRYVYDLATYCARASFDVVVAAGSPGTLFEKLAAQNIRTVAIPELTRDVGIMREFITLFAILKVIAAERPAVVHLSSSKAGGVGAAAAFLYNLAHRGRRARVVFTAHGWGFNEDRGAVARLLIFLASVLSTMLHNVVICINRREYDQARRFVPARKLALVYNGISPLDLLPRSEARSLLARVAARPLDADAVIIGTIAELTKNKGLEYLIEAARILANAAPAAKSVILIIGDGEMRRELGENIRAHALENSVRLLGAVPDAARLLAGLDVFVLPSIKEGLPYTILEALQARIPIVATGVGGIPELVADGENGLVVPAKDAAALAAALGKLAADAALRARLGAGNESAGAGSFSLEKMATETILQYTKRA